MTAQPDAEERRIQARIRQLVDGPAAKPPPMPPGPPPPAFRPRERDWLDDILDTPAPAPARSTGGPVELPGPIVKEPTAPVKPPRKRRRQRPAHHPDQQERSPRQSLADAWDNTPTRLRWLTYHATAAGAGWPLGWISWGTDTAAWYAAGHWVSPSAFALYGIGACLIALYLRSRAWAMPFAWAAAIPVSSVALGVLLYGTGYHP